MANECKIYYGQYQTFVCEVCFNGYPSKLEAKQCCKNKKVRK